MAGLLSYTRAEAAALPLTPETVRHVIAQSRRAVLAQFALSVGITAGCAWIAGHTTGAVSWLSAAVAALAVWGVLATGLSAWDHFRISAPLRAYSDLDMAKETDAKKFWWAHRGLFPYSWS